MANPNVRLRKELPDALAGHLHPVGGSATLNFPTDLGEPMAYCGYAKAIKQRCPARWPKSGRLPNGAPFHANRPGTKSP